MAAVHNRTDSSSGLVYAIIDRVSSASQNPSTHSTSDGITTFIRHLQELRHFLVDSSSASRAKDAFRRARGFEFLLQTVSIFSSALVDRQTFDPLRTEQLEALKSCLFVISDALSQHSINRLHFSSPSGINGWIMLETALRGLVTFAPTALASTPIEAINQLQLLFGVLFAFAFCEDSFVTIFRKNPIRSYPEESSVRTTTNGDATASESSTHGGDGLTGRMNSVRLDQPLFKSTDFVRNPEMILVAYRLWCILHSSQVKLSDEQHTAPQTFNASVQLGNLLIHFLLALRDIVESSEFNVVAIHKSCVLRPLLETLFSKGLSPTEFSIIDTITNELLKLGINNLNDAAYFFSAAEDNSLVLEKLHNAIKISRQPGHFLFDLSMHGHASLEFTELPKPFPPTDPNMGYSFTAWVCVRDFDDTCHITLFGAFDESQNCFVLIYLESNTHQLVLQTSISAPNPSTRFKSVTFEQRRWYHISLLHHAARNTRPSRASLFINGRFMEQRKCQYPDLPPTSVPRPRAVSKSDSKPVSAVVQCFFGTPRDLSPRLGSGVLSAKWALAGAHLFNEVLSEELVLVFFQMGPSYRGNFQDSLGSFQTYKASTQLNLINEERNGPGAAHSKLANAVKLKAGQLNQESNVAMSISPAAVIALHETKFLEMANPKLKPYLEEHFSSTSNDLIINSSVPLFSRALTRSSGFGSATGGTVVFRPLSVEDCCWRLCGSLPLSLKLIALASTPTNLLTATQILLQTVRENWRNSEVMERGNGFGVLAWILRGKMLQSSTNDPQAVVPISDFTDPSPNGENPIQALFVLLLEFLGVNLDSPQKSLLNNPLGYRQLVVDCHVWERATKSSLMLYFNQFIILTTKSQYKGFNIRRLNRMRIVKRLIEMMKEKIVDEDVLPTFLDALKATVECNFTAEVLRSLALFIIYAFSTISNVDLGFARNQSSDDPLRVPVASVELGVRTLEMLSDLICNSPDNGRVHKFARTITVKWLLNLLNMGDVRIVNSVLKILVRILIATDTVYLTKFREKAGFLILGRALSRFWRNSETWERAWQLLFGMEIPIFDNDGRDPSPELLKTIESSNVEEFFCPEMAAVLLSMIQKGLQDRFQTSHEVQETNESLNETFRSDHEAPSLHNVESAVKIMVLLHGLKPFRNLSTSHNFTRDLLVAIFDATKTKHETNNASNTEQPMRPMDEDLQSTPLLKTSNIKSTDQNNPDVSNSDSTAPQSTNEHNPPTQRSRRSSSFIIVSPELFSNETVPEFQKPLAPKDDSSALVLLFRDSSCQQIVQLLVCVLVDQVINFPEFPGLGLFLKAPPDTLERRSWINSIITSETINKLSIDLAANLELLHEPRRLINITRFVQQTYEAILEGWFLGGTRTLLNFLGMILDHLDQPAVRTIKAIRLCSTSISTLQGLFRHLSLYYLLTCSSLDTRQSWMSSTPREIDIRNENIPSESLDPAQDLIQWLDLLAPLPNDASMPFSSRSSDPSLLSAMCYVLSQKVFKDEKNQTSPSMQLLRSITSRKHVELRKVISRRSLADTWEGFLSQLSSSSGDFFTWAVRNKEQLEKALADAPRFALVQFIEKENTVSRSLSTSRITKREERLNQRHLNELAEQHSWTEYNSATTAWARNIFNSEVFKQLRARQDYQDSQEYLASLQRRYHDLPYKEGRLSRYTSDSKWCLDGTEGRSRIRIRLFPANDAEDLEYRPKRRQTLSLKSQISHSSSPSGTGTSTPQPEHLIQDSRRSKAEPPQQDIPTNGHNTGSLARDGFEMIQGDGVEEDESEDKNRKVMRSLQRGEKVRDVYNVSQIRGLEAQETLLIIGEKSLYLLSNLFQRADGEIVNVWQAPVSERDPFTQMITGREVKRPKTISVHDVDTGTRHWPWSEIISVSKRRFLSRPVALEIFFQDGRSYLLTALSEDSRNGLCNALLAKAVKLRTTEAIDSDSWRIELLPNPKEASYTVGSKLVNAFNLGSNLPATARWVRGEISNFQYLMMVNTMAGRTFNDLTQYPVFPWVISDYTSKELDLSNPKSFRDLTKPMGCQTPDREMAFRERFKAFEDMSENTTPAFHYGTHYSTAMIVTSYLIRLQPFVDAYLLLQGGSFDHADRLFYSIEKAWLSASRETMTDVRELTPEFYCLPDFLRNINKYDFGIREATGEKIDDVKLPPWAKGDPELFIAKNREALESPFVSQNLHSWIDLVFGLKQRGEAAIEAINVFHHLSYQDATNLETMDDLHERLATIGIIHNFGQTPTQVFTRPHERRESSGLTTKKLPRLIQSLARLPQPIYEHHSQISQLEYAVKQQRLLCCGPWRTLMTSKHGVVMDWGHSDISVRFYNPDSKEYLGICEQLHQDIITAARFVDTTLLTASYDCTVGVWNVAVAPDNVDLQQRGTLFSHKYPVTTLSVSRSLSTILSADLSGRVLLWDLNSLELVREIDSKREIRHAQINNTNGHILLCCDRRVMMFTLNGDFLLEQSVCSGPNDRIHCCSFYENKGNEYVDVELVFTGHRWGIVNVWRMVYSQGASWKLELVRRLDHTDPSITSGPNFNAAITAICPLDQILYTGDEEGRVFEWTYVR